MSSLSWSARCFLALPTGPDFDKLRDTLRSQLASFGVGVIDYRSGEPNEWRSVEDAVQGTDLMIADITGGNANVLFAMGVAAGMRKPILALAEYGTEVPFDLRSYRVIQYTPGDPRLQTYVESWVRDAVSSPRSLP